VSARALLLEAAARGVGVLVRREPAHADGWVLRVFGLEELAQAERERLRSELLRCKPQLVELLARQPCADVAAIMSEAGACAPTLRKEQDGAAAA
jgi:hypothetical protein